MDLYHSLVARLVRRVLLLKILPQALQPGFDPQRKEPSKKGADPEFFRQPMS